MGGKRVAAGEQPAVKLTRKKTVTRLEISGAMTIERAGELREALVKAFQPGKAVQLSLSAVNAVDASGLQLLCSAHRTAVSKGVDVSVEGLDEDIFLSAAELAGMFRPTGCFPCADGICIWKREPSQAAPAGKAGHER